MCNKYLEYGYWKVRDSSLIRKYELKRFETKKLDNINLSQSIIFDTGINSNNLGDLIIMNYCDQVFDEIGCGKSIRIPTHTHPSKIQEKLLLDNCVKLVAGTNILSDDLRKVNGWKYPKKLCALDHLCLLGVGWINYGEIKDTYTKELYEKILKNEFIHSVRDSYTEWQLKKIGIYNVINTGCPTMWKLTPQHCSKIPKQKADCVVTTITDYRQNKEYDYEMFKILLDKYKTVYFWPQGLGDTPYIKSLLNHEQMEKIIFLERSFVSYDSFLSRADLDYVGTRLHAGIHALNHLHRTIIIALDNRAIEIHNDTNIPIVKRENIKDLEEQINRDFTTEILINTDNIEYWKKQWVETNE